MRALMVIIGILLAIFGVFCLIDINMTIASLALISGILMLIYGIMLIVAYFSNKKTKGFGWVLAEGIITAILGFIFLIYPGPSDLVICIMFGIWLTVSGIIGIIQAFTTRKETSGSTWVWLLIVGILCVILGIYGFFHPIIMGFALSILIGIFFILQGVNAIMYGGVKQNEASKEDIE